MVSSFIGLRRSSSLSRSNSTGNLNPSSAPNNSSISAKQQGLDNSNKKGGNSILSLLNVGNEESFISNNNSNDNNNSYNSSGNLKRSNSTSTNNSSLSDDSVIIHRSSSLSSDKNYVNSYDLSSPLENIEEPDYEDEENYHCDQDDDEDPFENEALLQDAPLSPPKELHPGRLYALYEFSGPDPSQCDLEYDDAVILLNDDDSYWWLIKKVNDGKIGFAPAECLETPGERLARLNCWKNEELERISKEENKKKSKSLLSLTRKASKLASGGSSGNNSNSDLHHHHGLLKKKSSSKSVIFAETVSYSDPAYLSDSEDNEDYGYDYDDEYDNGRERHTVEEDDDDEKEEEKDDKMEEHYHYAHDAEEENEHANEDVHDENKQEQENGEKLASKQKRHNHPAAKLSSKQPQSQTIDEDVHYSDDNDTLDGKESVLSKQQQKIVDDIDDAINISGIDSEDESNTEDEVATEEYISNPGSPEVNTPLVVSKIRKKSIDNLKNASLFKAKNSKNSLNTKSISTRTPTPPATRAPPGSSIKNANKALTRTLATTRTSPDRAGNASSPPRHKNVNNGSLTPSPQNSSLEPGHRNLQRNSMLSISDDDASLYNRSSSLYDGESVLFRRSQDLETMLHSTPLSYQSVGNSHNIGANTKNSYIMNGNSNGTNSNGNSNSTRNNLNSISTPPSANSSVLFTGNTNPLAAPTHLAKRTNSMAGSIKTVSSSYSIGEYSPSSSEFESDSNSNSNNQTPTKFQVLNSLQLSNSTINNGGLKGKISNSSSMNFSQLQSIGAVPGFNSNPTGASSNGSNSSLSNNTNIAITGNSDSNNNGNDANQFAAGAKGVTDDNETDAGKENGDYISDITDNVDLESGYSTDNYTDSIRPKASSRKNKNHEDSGDNDEPVRELSLIKDKKFLGSPVNFFNNDFENNSSTQTFEPIPKLAEKTEQTGTPGSTATGNSTFVPNNVNEDLANNTISEIDKQLRELTDGESSYGDADISNIEDTFDDTTGISINDQHASADAKPKLLLSPSKSLAKSRGTDTVDNSSNRLEDAKFDDLNLDDYENGNSTISNSNSNSTVGLNAVNSRSAGAASGTSGVYNHHAGSSGHANVSSIMINSGKIGQSNSTTITNNSKFSPDEDDEDVYDDENRVDDFTPNSSFFTNSSSSLVNEKPTAAISDINIANFTNNKINSHSNSSSSSNNNMVHGANVGVTAYQQQHYQHGATKNSSSFVNRTNSLSDNSESVDSHITPITSALIESDIHSKAAINSVISSITDHVSSSTNENSSYSNPNTISKGVGLSNSELHSGGSFANDAADDAYSNSNTIVSNRSNNTSNNTSLIIAGNGLGIGVNAADTGTMISISDNNYHDANLSFCSLLEDYHSEVNEMFYPLFNKVDSISARIAELKQKISSS